MPLATPEVVMGSSLLALFITWGIPRGLWTIIFAHVMFNISYVVVTVKARLRGFDWALEEAAMDLGANELQTFRKVTLPLIFPGILAAALLAFALSVDDFIITLFNSGNEVTFPLWVWGAGVAFPFSDHADFDDLLAYAKESAAGRIFTFGGFSQLAEGPIASVFPLAPGVLPSTTDQEWPLSKFGEGGRPQACP